MANDFRWFFIFLGEEWNKMWGKMWVGLRVGRGSARGGIWNWILIDNVKYPRYRWIFNVCLGYNNWI